MSRETFVKRHADLPIIFMTGFADTQAIVDVMGSDAKILQKPFRFPTLLRAIVNQGEFIDAGDEKATIADGN